MFQFLLSPEQGFCTFVQNGVPKLDLCKDPVRLKSNSETRTLYYEGNVGRVFGVLTKPYGSSHFNEKELGEMYYPTIVAIRVYAYEVVGFNYNRSEMMSYIAWQFYGQDPTSDFLDKTWLVYLMIKEFQKEVCLTLYSSVFEPLLPKYQSLKNYRPAKYPKYWKKTITKKNELDFLDQSHKVKNDEELEGTRGERLAMEYFRKEGIRFVYDQPVEYVCKYCGQHILRPDFLLPDLDVVVEIHGPQHFDFTKGFHTSYDDFVHQQLRDVDMRQFCHEFGYDLVEIPFNDREDIAMLLARALRNISKRKVRVHSKKQD